MDLARRAKKLVKKWQKAFVNHIEAIRNADSPLNGSRVSSPQFNGSIRDSDSLPGTPTSSEGQEKLKNIEGKKRGLKRKRAGSCESSPFGKDLEGELKSRTETPTDNVNTQELLGVCSSENTLSEDDSQCSPLYSNVSLQLSSSVTAHNVKNEKLDTERKSPEVSRSKTENGDVQEQAQGSAATQNNSDSVDGGSLPGFKIKENSDVSVPKPKQDNVCDGVKQSDTGTNTTVEESSVECNTELVGMDEDSPEPDVLPVRPPRSPSEMELEVTAQASGINGHFGPDGVWYNWTEVMPSSDGVLDILPYVLLE